MSFSRKCLLLNFSSPWQISTPNFWAKQIWVNFEKFTYQLQCTHWKCNFPMNLHSLLLASWLVCHNFQKRTWSYTSLLLSDHSFNQTCNCNFFFSRFELWMHKFPPAPRLLRDKQTSWIISLALQYCLPELVYLLMSADWAMQMRTVIAYMYMHNVIFTWQH